MPVVREEEARRAIEKGEVAPCYLLVGDDHAGKAEFVKVIEALVPPDMEAFNLHRYYSDESPPRDVLDSARTPSLLGGLRVIEWHRFEGVLKPKGRGGARLDDENDDEEPDTEAATDQAEPVDASLLGEIGRYLAAPVPETTLVCVARDADRAKRPWKLFEKHAVVVEFWGLKGDRALKGWNVAQAVDTRASEYIRARVGEAGKRIDPGAIKRLADHAGADMGSLRNAVELALTYVGERPKVTESDVQAVARGEVSVDPWAVTNAIGRGDVSTALKELALSLDAGSSPYQVLGQIGWFVRDKMRDVGPEQMRTNLDAVLRTDLAMKTSGSDRQVLLERLVVELCGRPPARRGPWPSGRR